MERSAVGYGVLHLVIAILCSGSLALIFRVTESRGLNRLVVTAGNYATAVVVALTLVGTDSVVLPDPTTFVIAIPAGFLFFASFILYQRAVRDRGPGTAAMFGKLGVLVPTILSMALWREFPQSVQYLGIVLALAAVGLAIIPTRASTRTKARSSEPETSTETVLPNPLPVLLLLSMGLAEFANKLFERSVPDGSRAVFLAILFAAALAFTVVTIVARRVRPSRAELLAGFFVGVPNLFSSFFLIASLRSLPAAAVFPAYSAGSMMVAVLGARLFFGTRLPRSERIAVVLAGAALVLVNLPA